MSARVVPSAGDEEGYKDTPPPLSGKEAEVIVLLCPAPRSATAGSTTYRKVACFTRAKVCACDTQNQRCLFSKDDDCFRRELCIAIDVTSDYPCKGGHCRWENTI